MFRRVAAGGVVACRSRRQRLDLHCRLLAPAAIQLWQPARQQHALHEADLFFEDLSGEVIQDDVFARLLTFPNVLVTAHQAFFTSNALAEIARVTMANLTAFADGQPLTNAVTVDFLKK